MDPDDYIKQYGGDAFREKIIGNPHSYMSFIMAYAKRSKNLSYENDVLQYIHEVLEELSLRSSPVERDLYIRQLSTETGISPEAIHQQFMKMAGKQSQKTKTDFVEVEEQVRSNHNHITPERKKTGTERAERLLLYHLLNDGALFDRLREDKPKFLFVTIM